MNNVEIYIGNLKAEISRDTEVALSLSLSDLSNPETRTAGYTLPITLPNCPRNNELLHNLYDLEIDPNDTPAYRSQMLLPDALMAQTFNRNTKNFGKVLVNGFEVINGLVGLDSISQSGYELTFNSGGFAWAKTFQNKLSEIKNLPIYCHDITTINNWNVDANTSDLVFPLVDYGNFAQVLFDYANSPIDANLPDVTDFFPAAFVLALLRKAFADAGYTLILGEGLELETLIMPFTNSQLVPQDLTLLEDTDMVIGIGTDIVLQTTFKPLLLSSTSTNINGQWQAVGLVEGFVVEANAAICNADKTLSYEVLLKFDASGFLNPNVAVNPFINGVAQTPEIFATPSTGNTFLRTFELKQGDVLTFDFDAGGGLYSIGSIEFYISRLAIDASDSEYLLFDLAKQLPDITQFELLSGLIVMHNLYMQSDEIARRVFLARRDEFFLSPISDLIPYAAYPSIPAGNDTQYPNWTQQVDTKKGYLINFQNNYYAQKVRFTYQQGDDFLCQDFQNANGERAYGFYEWQNKYLLGEPLQEVAVPIFAPTRGAFTFASVPKAGAGRYMPLLWNADYRNPDSNTTFELNTGYTPRILKYRYTTGAHPQSLYINYAQGTLQYITTQIFDAYFDLPPQAINSFPIAINPTDSLRFDASNPNHAGLFARFYKQQFENIEASRALTLQVFLSEKDIAGIDFRKPIRIKNKFYQLQSIEDWIAGAAETCKVTLLEI